jgi:beta-glucosidase
VTSEVVFPYQDPALGVEQRADDLLSRMSLDDKVALFFHPMAAIGGLDEPGLFGTPSTGSNLARGITHMNILTTPDARALAEWHNEVQEYAQRHPLRIPVTISSDPRHAFNDNPAASFIAGPFSQWPEQLGLAAIGSEELVQRFAEMVREEYVAVGIRTALHPQIDLATEPRWARQSTTFGEDAALCSRLAVAYVRGLQGAEAGPTSVSAMAKHFPGGGPQKDGEDPHFAHGREQVYPGGQFDLHLEPFKAVLAAGVAQIMPYYGMPVGTDLEEVGFGFNKQVITGLLREQLGFDGIVCTDWGILKRSFWGVEHLSYEERMLKALDAGVDQFGGEVSTDVLMSLVKSGAVSEARIEVSARRLLREKFRLGLFDDPFVDPDRAERVVGASAARADGLAAQAAAHTLLKNAAAGLAQLPLHAGLKVYVENLSRGSVGGRAHLVATPGEADVAVLRLKAPWESRGEPGGIESYFHGGSLAFSAEELERVQTIAATVPTVVDVYLDRPAILAEISEAAASLIVNFGASDEVFVSVLFGDAEPQGRLPFDIPSSMKAVEESRSDTPFDTQDPTYRFGFGLRYDGSA